MSHTHSADQFGNYIANCVPPFIDPQYCFAAGPHSPIGVETPSEVGQYYYDELNSQWYIATGTGVNDWETTTTPTGGGTTPDPDPDPEPTLYGNLEGAGSPLVVSSATDTGGTGKNSTNKEGAGAPT